MQYLKCLLQNHGKSGNCNPFHEWKIKQLVISPRRQYIKHSDSDRHATGDSGHQKRIPGPVLTGYQTDHYYHSNDDTGILYTASNLSGRSNSKKQRHQKSPGSLSCEIASGKHSNCKRMKSRYFRSCRQKSQQIQPDLLPYADSVFPFLF